MIRESIKEAMVIRKVRGYLHISPKYIGRIKYADY